MINFLTWNKTKPYHNEIEEISKFWTVDLDDYSLDEFIYLQRVVQIYADFALIGCHHDTESSVNYLKGFIILKKRRTKACLLRKLGLQDLELEIATGYVEDQIAQCLGGKSHWQHGKIVFKSGTPESSDWQANG